MTLIVEYHKPMRPFIPPSVALFGSLVISLLLALPAAAQINGPPASVTSPGFGGRPINGPPASVTSVGPQGFAPAHPPLKSAGNGSHHRNGEENRHHRDSDVGPVWFAVPVPYAVDNSGVGNQQDENDGEDDADYQGGPTVFDRRGNGPSSYVPPVKNPAPAHLGDRDSSDQPDDPPAADPEPPLPSTLLVLKDGHNIEVQNYAIVGHTLYDLTPGHQRKIPLKDIDLDATQKQNDERGVTFQLPQSAQGS
jgi:hypothetical protein